MIAAGLSILLSGCNGSNSVAGSYKCNGTYTNNGSLTLSENGKVKGVIFGDNKKGTWEKFDETSIMIKGISRSETEFKITSTGLETSDDGISLKCVKQ